MAEPTQGDAQPKSDAESVVIPEAVQASWDEVKRDYQEYDIYVELREHYSDTLRRGRVENITDTSITFEIQDGTQTKYDGATLANLAYFDISSKTKKAS